MELRLCVQDDESFERISFGTCIADSQSNEIQRFDLLRNELIELEKRVQRSADRSENEEVSLNHLIMLVFNIQS